MALNSRLWNAGYVRDYHASGKFFIRTRPIATSAARTAVRVKPDGGLVGYRWDRNLRRWVEDESVLSKLLKEKTCTD